MLVEPLTVAEAAVGRPLAHATVIARGAIEYDPFLPGRVVERATGSAETVDGDQVAWSAVVKLTSGVDLRAARRELSAYRDGVAVPAPSVGLRAPTLLGWDAGPDHVELWLEALVDELGGRWPTSRFGLAAREVASWDAAHMRTPQPVGFDSEDAWAERHGQPERIGEAVAELDALGSAPTARATMALLDDPGFRRTKALIESTEARIDRLATLPQTPLHHDLVRSNLFALADGGTAAIDWENVGRGPLGVDLAPLVVGSVRRGEASADELPAMESLVLDEYASALRSAGVDADAEVRLAYRVALGLRWHVVLGAIRTSVHPIPGRMRGSLPDESPAESLRHLAAVSRHILRASL